MLKIYFFNYYFKICLVGFQYEPISLDVNKVYFEEKQDILNTREKLEKGQSVTDWCRCGK